MPPAEQDGKKPAPSQNAAADPAPASENDFDWDKAIEEWDPSFFGEGPSVGLDVGPDPSLGVVVPSQSGPIKGLSLPAQATTKGASASAPSTAASSPAAAVPQTSVATEAAAAASAKEAAQASPHGPSHSRTPPVSGSGTSDAEAAPLPPPPALATPAIEIEVDLSRTPPRSSQIEPLDRVETTLAMDAGEMDRLAAMLRSDERATQPTASEPAASPAVAKPMVSATPAPAAVGRPEEEDFYDNIVVEAASGSKRTPAPVVQADSNKTPEIAPPAEALQATKAVPEPGQVMQPLRLAAASFAPSPSDDDDEELAIHVEVAPAIEPTPSPALDQAVVAPQQAPASLAAPPNAFAQPAPAEVQPVAAQASAVPTPEPASASALRQPQAPLSLAAAVAPEPASAAVAAPAAPSEHARSVAASVQAVEPPASLKPATGAASRPSQALSPRRIPLPAIDKLPPPSLTRPSAAGAPEASLRRQFQSLLQAERELLQSRDPKRAGQLSIAAARQSEALREASDALDHYRAAQDSVPTLRAALRGSRRVLSWPGPTAQPDEATAYLDRELERSSASEAQGLSLIRAELQRVQGQLSESAESFGRLAKSAGQTAGRTGATAALLGLCDVALARDAEQDVGAALDALQSVPQLSVPLVTALQICRARHEEAAGRSAQARSRYEAIVSSSGGTALSASLGLLRCAVPTSKGQPAAGSAAYGALLKARLPRGLHQAIARQHALHEVGPQRPALLQQDHDPADWLTAEEVALSYEASGDFAAAAAAYLKLAESVRDPLQRSLALSSAGEAFFRSEQLDDARRALLDALKQASAADIDVDAFALRLLERICFRQGRMDDLLSLYGSETGLPRQRAAYMHYLAGSSQLQRTAEGGGGAAPSAEARAAGMAQLQKAVQLCPDFAPALLLLCDHLLADGRSVEAARLLVAASEVEDEDASRAQRLLQQSYREDAARLFLTAARPSDAARALLGQADSVTSLLPATRWRLAALAPLLADDGALAEQVANVLAIEAEQTPYRQRVPALWYARGILLSGSHTAAQPSLGPVEDSFRRTLLADPGHAAALLALHLRALHSPPDQLAHSPLVHVVLDGLRTRMEKAGGRPEAMLWALRLGAAQEFEARDAASALMTYKHLRTFAKEHAALVGLEDTLFVTAWRAGHAIDSLEHELHVEQDPDRRYALLILLGEQLEAQGHPARAAERFAHALECRPGHPVAKACLVRAYQAASLFAELDAFTARELKEATDVNTRVGAYERQARLAMQRSDSEGLINAYRNVLTFDTNNHAAMRALERHFIASQQWGELVHLYEQMGLTATDTAYGVHIHLDRARLRERLVRQGHGDASTLENELENDFRLAMYRDRHCLPALRSLLAAALNKKDAQQAATLCKNAAEQLAATGDIPGHEQGDARSAAVFYLHAAEAKIQASQSSEEVLDSYRAALKLMPDLIPALRGLLHFAIVHQEFATVADAAEGLASGLHDADERYLHYMLAGVVSQELLKDTTRARRAFSAALRLLPDRDEAFERLRVSYNNDPSGPGNAKALADLLSERLQNSNDPPAQKSNLRLELSQLLLGPLADRQRARAELELAVAATPDHPAALYTLGKLLTDDREWARAAELLERYSQSEQRPSQLVALHLLLADMYQEHLADTQRAIIHYTRVLQLQPQNLLALNKVADLFLAQQKLQGVLPILRRLVKYTDDKAKRIAYYHRIAALSEQEKDPRGALEALRQAVDTDPMHLPAIGELAKFYIRQSDLSSMRIHLDRAAARFRPILRERPRDAAALNALLQIFIWRGQSDSAQVTASVLQTLGHTLPPEVQAQLDKLPPRKEPSKNGLVDSSLDDVLFPARVAPGFRALFRLLAEPLHKLYAGDSKKLAALGVDRRERLPRSGHPVRDLANKIAAGFGIEDFDVYITAAQRTDEDGKKGPLCTLEALDHPTLILSHSLIDGASEAERRFLLGGLLKIVQSQLVLPLSLNAYDLGLVIGSLVRLYVPSYTPIGYAEKQIANEASRIKRAIPSKLQGQLLPHAMECSAAALDFEGISELITLASHHAGLALTGDIGSAMSMLRRKGGGSERLVDDLLRFAVSEEFAELRRIVTA